MKKSKIYWIYILECTNGNYYTGYSQNLVKRFRQHLDGKANSRYTRSFRPVRIAQCWRFEGTIGDALKIERAIKTRSRTWKVRLIDAPDKLHIVVKDKLEIDVEIFNFNPQAVEKKARETDSNEIQKSADPFRDVPLDVKKTV